MGCWLRRLAIAAWMLLASWVLLLGVCFVGSVYCDAASDGGRRQAFLRLSWIIPGAPWSILSYLGAILGHLGAISAPLGSITGHLGLLELFGAGIFIRDKYPPLLPTQGRTHDKPKRAQDG